MNSTYTFSIGLHDRDGKPLGIRRETIGECIAAILACFQQDGFTIRWVDGYWDGKREPAMEVVVSADFSDADVLHLARCFAAQFNQACVGIHKSAGMTFISNLS